MAANFKPCSVPDCNGNSHRSNNGRNGYCSSHYQRLMVHGDPLAGGPTKGHAKRFLNDVVLPYAGDDCLIWPYCRDEKGYGRIASGESNVPVSRLVCEETHGAPPTPEHEAAHSCGKGHEGCVAKKHLSWKTRIENRADRIIHGTHNHGERNHTAKLTEQQVREILALEGTVTRVEIAEMYGVSLSGIAHIHLGYTWAWLKRSW